MMDVQLQKRNFEQLSEAKKYYRWFADSVQPFVGQKVLEIGCGEGNISELFLDKAQVHGIDLEAEYIANIKKRFSKRSNFSAEVADINDSETRLRLARGNFDTIICFNVLEHIEDDAAAVRYLYDILAPGGSVIILVPAFNSLMSEYDLLVGHYRRYTKRTLFATVREAGFEVKRVFYFNALGAFGWLVTYKWRKRREPGTGSVALLEFLVPFLKRVEQIIPMPFGLSVIAVGRKPS
jgi:2-polyprenyl-3-methyl-5-hydroxy-6-metoxy-1,4-benzoquinol methylase